jgi:hypothetical protein
MANQVILTCPFCGWKQKEAVPPAELPVICNQCQGNYDPIAIPPIKILEGKVSASCLHTHLQDAGGMAYCPDCGVTEW